MAASPMIVDPLLQPWGYPADPTPAILMPVEISANTHMSTQQTTSSSMSLHRCLLADASFPLPLWSKLNGQCRQRWSRSDQILLSHVLVCGLMCIVIRHRVDIVSMTTIMLLLHSIVPFMPGQRQSAISQKQSMQCLVSTSVMHKGDGLEIQKDKVFCAHDCITKA